MKTSAEMFRVMADRIDRNPSEEFGGAVLIVPPQGGEAIEILLIDPKKDPAAFWGTVQAKVQVAVTELQERQSNAFGMRR